MILIDAYKINESIKNRNKNGISKNPYKLINSIVISKTANMKVNKFDKFNLEKIL